MPACVAYGCTSRPSKKIPGVTFHAFPQNEERRRLWILAVRRKDWTPSKYSRLCSRHFPEEMMDRTSLSCVRVRENAIPTIFEGFPSYLKKKKSLVKKADPHVSGNVHIVQVVPVASKTDKAVEQDGESVQEEEIRDISDDKDKKHDSSLKVETAGAIVEIEDVKYLVCECDSMEDSSQIQILNPGFSLDADMTQKFHLQVSKNNIIRETTPLMAKRKEHVEKNDLQEKTDLLFKISTLETKIDYFRKQRESDRKKIKTLQQSQRRNVKRIHALNEYITILKSIAL